MYKETQTRTLIKSTVWRVVATLNSYFILNIGLNDNLKSAILMNVTAFLMYYTFERMFNNIKWGKVGDKK